MVNNFPQRIEEIKNDVIDLVENRSVFNRLRELLKSRQDITNNLFFDHYVVNYVSTVSSGVRRQIDKKTNRGGLRKLLEDIIANPSLVEKKDYISHWKKLGAPAGLATTGEIFWKEKYGGREFIDVSIVQADLFRLDTLTSKVKDFVDKRVAHKDKEWNEYELTYGELDKAIDTLEEMTIKYYELFTGAGFTTLVPIIHYPWEEIFEKPWVS